MLPVVGGMRHLNAKRARQWSDARAGPSGVAFGIHAGHTTLQPVSLSAGAVRSPAIT